jgi:hypothetical protein
MSATALPTNLTHVGAFGVLGAQVLLIALVHLLGM